MPQIPPNLLAETGWWTRPLDPFENLPVGLHHTAKILAETVFVEDSIAGVAHLQVPKAARIGADLIGHHQIALGAEAQLDLEIHQLQVDVSKEAAHTGVHRHGQALHLLALVCTQQRQALQACIGEQRVAVGVVFVIKIE